MGRRYLRAWMMRTAQGVRKRCTDQTAGSLDFRCLFCRTERATEGRGRHCGISEPPHCAATSWPMTRSSATGPEAAESRERGDIHERSYLRRSFEAVL